MVKHGPQILQIYENEFVMQIYWRYFLLALLLYTYNVTKNGGNLNQKGCFSIENRVRWFKFL